MTVKSMLREAAARAGLHVTRQTENPSHTLLGLRGATFGTVFDVGANEGQFARFARGVFPEATLHCFEPTPDAHAALSRWATSDGRAHAVQLALGESESVCEMNVHSSHTPSSSLLSTTERSHRLYPVTESQRRVTVRVARLDDYIASLPERPAGDWLLKLDVQGFEAHVLRGAQQTLAEVRACIVEVCLDALYEGQGTFAEVHDLARAGGLRYAGNVNQVYAADGHVVYLDALFIR